MPKYKNIETDNVNDLYNAVKEQVDFEIGGDTPLSEIIAMVDEYLTGKIDSADLLSDIQNQLDQIPGRIDDLDAAIAAIPGFSIQNGLKTVLIGMCENQQNIYRIEQRELKAWRFMIKNVVVE